MRALPRKVRDARSETLRDGTDLLCPGRVLKSLGKKQGTIDFRCHNILKRLKVELTEILIKIGTAHRHQENIDSCSSLLNFS